MHNFYIFNKNIMLVMDLYNKSMYEFKLTRAAQCPSFLLMLEEQKDKLLHANLWGFLFVLIHTPQCI